MSGYQSAGLPRKPGMPGSGLGRPEPVEYASDEIIIKFKPQVSEEIRKMLTPLFTQGKLDKDKFQKPVDFNDCLKTTDYLRIATAILDLKSLRDANTKFNAQIEPVLKGLHRELVLKNKGFYSLEEERLLNKKQAKTLTEAKEKAKVFPDLSAIYLLKIKGDAQEAVKQYIQFKDIIEYAELNYKRQLHFTPTDEHYPKMWNLNNTAQAYPVPGGQTATGTHGADIDNPEAWNIPNNPNGRGVVIAVLDTGIDYTHPDIDDNLWRDTDGSCGYDFSDNDNDPSDYFGHGTHCAGTIAAEANHQGVIGVAFNSKIMTVKIFPNAYDNVILNAFYYAIDKGAKVLSNSWGSGPSNPDNHSQTISNGISYAYDKGAVIIFAAGNANGDAARYFSGTLDVLDKVILVAATDSQNKKASFSNYGHAVSVAAPGVDILSSKRLPI